MFLMVFAACLYLRHDVVELTGVILSRLRQVDVKAEHFERSVSRVEQERDDWERKHGVSLVP